MGQVRDISAVLLQRYNVQRGHVIGVLGPATPDTLAALLAVMSIGAVYVPLDPVNSRTPDLHLTLVTGTHEQLSNAISLIGDTPQLTLPVTGDIVIPMARDMSQTREDDNAYIMWTSGTTSSAPTRVTVPHACVLPNLVCLSVIDQQPLTA